MVRIFISWSRDCLNWPAKVAGRLPESADCGQKHRVKVRFWGVPPGAQLTHSTVRASGKVPQVGVMRELKLKRFNFCYS